MEGCSSNDCWKFLTPECCKLLLGGAGRSVGAGAKSDTAGQWWTGGAVRGSVWPQCPPPPLLDTDQRSSQLQGSTVLTSTQYSLLTANSASRSTLICLSYLFKIDGSRNIKHSAVRLYNFLYGDFNENAQSHY